MMQNKNKDIEVLRAIAILYTMVHHIGQLYEWKGGWEILFRITTFWGGVDLFFCISGFVIATGLLRNSENEKRSSIFISFWIKRVYRIWPAALLWALLPCLLACTFNQSGAFGDLKKNIVDLVSVVTHTANLHFLDCSYYKQGMCGDNHGIYWSLSLEEQFYLIAPFLILLLDRKKLLLVLTALILIQLPLNRATWTPLWAIRSDAILLGVLIAAVRHYWPAHYKLLEPRFLRRPPAAITLFAMLAMLIALVPTRLVVWFDTGLLALVCAAAVFVASHNKDYLFPDCLPKQWLTVIGSRSFSLYLVHTPAYWTTRELFHRWYPGTTFNSTYTVKFTATALILIVMLTELTYRLIEEPLRSKGRKLASSATQLAPQTA